MQLTIAEAMTRCPYCGNRAVTLDTFASGNPAWPPYHVAPVGECPAFAHWDAEEMLRVGTGGTYG